MSAATVDRALVGLGAMSLVKHSSGTTAAYFTDDHGRALSIAKAREKRPGLFNLHMAVKDCYARISENHKKDLKEHGIYRRRVSLLLPKSEHGALPTPRFDAG